jgi:small redox-active disulfide protein 2
MKIEILGTGCKRCDQLYVNAREAISQVDSAGTIEVKKINDINYFVKMGVFLTPGLVIDGEVISVGKVLPADEIRKKLTARL